MDCSECIDWTEVVLACAAAAGVLGAVFAAYIGARATRLTLKQQIEHEKDAVERQDLRGLYAAAAHAALIEVLAVRKANLNMKNVDLGEVWAKVEILAPEHVRSAFTAFANARLQAVQGGPDELLEKAYTGLCQAIQRELGTPVSRDLPFQ